VSEGNGKYAPKPGNIPGVRINLGGVNFVLAPLGLRLTREFEAKAKALEKAIESGDVEAGFEFGAEIIHASLLRNYPDITMDEVRELIDVANMIEAQQKIMGASGLERVSPGELPPRG
jgi:hypothetical protein